MPPFVKPYYPPTTLHTQFSIERPLTPPPFALRINFPIEGLSLPRERGMPTGVDPQSLHSPVEGPDLIPNLIPKPPGEFNRPKNGYNLEVYCKQTLGWMDSQLAEVKVSVGWMLNHVIESYSCPTEIYIRSGRGSFGSVAGPYFPG